MSDTRSGARLRGWLPRPCVDAVLGTAWRQALGDLLLACLVVALALWPTAFELASVWQENGAYHYAWLVAPTFVYLVGWHSRDQILAQTPQPDAAGVIVAVVAALGWSVAAAANIDIGRQLALLVVIQGLALAALGRRLYRRLLPVMALLFLMLPSGNLLLAPLRWLTVKAVEWFALASGMPFPSGGFLVWVELPEGCDGDRLFDDALERGITLTPGSLFSPSGRHARHIRLSACHHFSDRQTHALMTLGELAKGQFG